MAVKLVAFDGDDTLWTPLSGVNLSDRTADDIEGYPSFTYAPTGEPLHVRRSDGALFRLRPEAAPVMEELALRGVLVGVISYNHIGNVRRILEAFGLLAAVRYIVAEWHTGKDLMMRAMLRLAEADGHTISPDEVLLVDDDPWEIYGKQLGAMGALFTRFGVEITDLSAVLDMLEGSPGSRG
jgi:predicted phosphatase